MNVQTARRIQNVAIVAGGAVTIAALVNGTWGSTSARAEAISKYDTAYWAGQLVLEASLIVVAVVALGVALIFAVRRRRTFTRLFVAVSVLLLVVSSATTLLIGSHIDYCKSPLAASSCGAPTGR